MPAPSRAPLHLSLTHYHPRLLAHYKLEHFIFDFIFKRLFQTVVATLNKTGHKLLLYLSFVKLRKL